MEEEQIHMVPGSVYALRNIVMLAAFACEARRTLSELDIVAKLVPELDATLTRLVDHRGEWSTYEDTTANVLRYVADELDKWEAPT